MRLHVVMRGMVMGPELERRYVAKEERAPKGHGDIAPNRCVILSEWERNMWQRVVGPNFQGCHVANETR